MAECFVYNERVIVVRKYQVRRNINHMRKITLLPLLMLVLAACGVTTPSSSTPTSSPSTTSASSTSTSTSSSTATSSSSASSAPSSSEPVSSVISIQEARQRTEGADVSVRGVVTRVLRQKSFYIQQGDFAITVFGYEGSDVIVPGDFVEVYGFIGNFNGLVQLTGAAGSGLPEVTKLTGTAPTITPLELTESTYDSETLKLNNDGRLISIKGLKLSASFTPLVIDQSQATGNANATFKLGAKNVDARFDRYINVPGREAINTFFNGMSTNTKFDYEGILGEFSTGIQLQVTDDSDFTLNSDPAVLPTAITVTSPSTPAEVVVGLGLQLGTTVLPENADDKSVTWSSSDDTIATVSSTGLVSGVSVGTVVITATSVASNLVTGTISVTVTPAPLTLEGVEFGVGDQSLKVGQSIYSEATLLPLGYVGQGITYTSSDTAVATVTSAGVIEARAAGTATITAAATEDNTKTDTLTVTITAVDLIATIKSAVADTPVTVNAVVTKIYAANEFYIQNGTAAIRVLGYTGPTLEEGDFVQVSGLIKISSSINQIGNTSTAPTVSQIEFLTAPEVTELIVTEANYNTTAITSADYGRVVKMAGMFPSQPWVPVVNSATVNRIFILGQTNVTVRISQFIFATEITALNSLFTDFWKNDLVNYEGVISAFGGSLQLLPSGAKDFTLVEADPVPVESISVTSAGSLTSIAEGVTLQLSATVLPSNADVLTITWSSSDVLKATVSETGLVTAVAAGTVDITATSTSDPLKFGTLSLTITPPPASLEAIEIVATKSQLETSETLQLSINYLPLGYSGQGVTWSTSSAELATVSVTGLVTALAVGSVTITAESTENTAFKDTIDFTIVEPFKNIVINEVYGGGGNSGAVYTNDFVELYNPNNYEVSLEGYAVQYTSSAGTFNNVAGSFVLTSSHKISPNSYFLIQFAAGSTPSAALPTPDAIGTLALSGTGGKIALLKNNNQAMVSTAGKVDNSLSYLSDFVGWGTSANQWEGDLVSPATNNNAAVTANATSINRATNGADTNNNKVDFPAAATPSPRNSTFSS